MNNNNNAAMELVCKTANSLFPELNVRINEISHPTEAFITRILIHCLRAFGFRVEPPYNIQSEGTNSSKEKRMFLRKLCRQVELILQISFPGKTYTYYDIIQPTAKKTLNTLDVLFNYWCFYKMHKKEVITPILAKNKDRQTLLTNITSMRRELDQRKKASSQAKNDITKCEANINKLQEQFPKVQAELNDQMKVLRRQQADIAMQEEELSGITRQVEHFKQLLVLDSEVEVVKVETKQIAAQIENLKAEMSKQQQTFMEHRNEIENISQLNNEIDKTMNILPEDVLNVYRENLKTKERLEKSHALLVAEHRGQLDAKDKSKQSLEQVEMKLKAHKVQFEQNAQLEQQKIIDEKENIERNLAEASELKINNDTTQKKIDEEERTTEHLKAFVSKLFGNQKNFT